MSSIAARRRETARRKEGRRLENEG